jgi:hypothetical protein
VTWVAWRLQRNETAIVVAVMLLIAAVLVPTGIEMANAFHRDGLAGCSGQNPSLACQNAIGSFQARFNGLNDLLSWFTLMPGLIGVLLAAPFLHELEHGTFRLAWTQSITRGRWIAWKLGVPLVLALAACGAYILLATWWREPFVRLNGRMDTGTYDSEGVVALGYVLFAFGLALAVGVLWRRAVAAITVAFVAYVASRITVDTWLRHYLVSPLHAAWKSTGSPPANFFNAQVLSMSGSGPGFQVHLGGGGILGGHAAVAAPSPRGIPVLLHAVYQPQSHFWPLQGVETALFGGIALVLIAFAAWWTHQRTT